MKKLVNHKSKKSNFKTAGGTQKNLERIPSSIPPVPPESNDKRKITKTATIPKLKDINMEKSEILVTPSKEYYNETSSQKVEDLTSIIAIPSPAPRVSTWITNSNLLEVGNTSQIKVMARFRPLNAVEKELSLKDSGSICAKFPSDETVSVSNTMNTSAPFTLDRIFDMETSQKKIYEIVARPTIIDVLNGYNGTIFAYGQSGSGKTFSMYGNDIYDDEVKGIIPRAIEDIFQFINDDLHKEIKFELKFSLVEIYKENLHDLLNPEIKHTDLKIKEHPKKGIYVSNLTEQYISTEEEFLILIENADDYRVVSETGLNKSSSRSHLVFQLEIIQKMPDDTEKRGMLYLVDLAGSEKVSKTHAIGETLEEAKKINLSLSTLGNVISALTSHNSDFIPYRDSKLTRILQDSLGGNYKTTLLVTCSPHIYNCEETISTLKFASRAKKIKNKVKMNIKRSVEQLEAIIEGLNRQLKLANDEILRLKQSKEAGDLDNEFFPSLSINEGTSSHFGEYTTVFDKTTTIPNFLGFVNHTKNKSEEDLNNFIAELKESIKNKEDIIKNQNEKIDSLQNDVKELHDKIKIYRQEIELNTLLNELHNLSKKNIEELKSHLGTRDSFRMKQLEIENSKLRENYRILETKYFNSLNEIEERMKLDNDYNIFDRSSIKSIVNMDFEDEVRKVKLNMENFFEENKDIMNNTVESYKIIYEHSKLYVNNLLKEFIKKKDMFGSKYGSDLKENIIFNDYEINTVNHHKNLKMNYIEMKNSYIKLSMLLTYYEKIIFDLLNRLLVDLKKFEVESQNKIAIDETCENFSKIMDLYLDVLENIKELKHKKEIEEKKIATSNQYIYNYNFKSSIKEQLEETERDEGEEVSETTISNNNKFMINLNGGLVKHLNFKEVEITDVGDLQENKNFRQEAEYIKRKATLKSPDTIASMKYRDSQTSPNIIEGLLPGSDYKMKAYPNSNIKRPVTKKSTQQNIRLNNMISRKITNRMDFQNDVLNSNSQANGNTTDEKLKGGEAGEIFIINNLNNPHVNMFYVDDQLENNDAGLRRISRPNIRRTAFLNKFRESVVSTGSKRGRAEAIDLVAENKYLNKELAMYKSMVSSLSRQWSSRKAIDSEISNILAEYKEDQRLLLADELERTNHIIKIYKHFYEDELLAKRKIIEDLAKIIDELYLNNNKYETSLYDTTKQNGRCISVPSGNIFSNYFSNPQANSFDNSTLVHRHTNNVNTNTYTYTHTNVSNNYGAKNRSLINDYLQYKKEKILNEYCYTEEDESNNMSVIKIAESYINEGGTATKKMDYILFSLDQDLNNMKIIFGSGLSGNIPAKSPLHRNIKMSLIGDTHSDIESPEATD